MNLKSTPTWYQKLPIALIHEKADAYGIDPFLISAICKQESNCNPLAIRYEPGNKLFVTPDLFAKKAGTTLSTEQIAQSTSWGLAQCMGFVARGWDYSGPMPGLCDPKNGLEIACQELHRLFKAHPKLEDVIASYNAGSSRKNTDGTYVNQQYVSSVLSYLKELTDSF